MAVLTRSAPGKNPVPLFLDMIKVSHTLFALPFAIGATFLAARGLEHSPSNLFLLLVKVVLAVFLARTAAMAFNRWADRHIDGKNPRTDERAIPSGRLSPGFVLATVFVAAGGFVAAAAWINPLAMKLSPIVLVVILAYSYSKRFTSLCHLILGAGLGLAPVGAWVAVRGTLTSDGNFIWTPWLLGIAVMLWTAGFDILYSTLDRDFDREHRLHSAPALLGISAALNLSRLLHLGMTLCLLALWWVSTLGAIFLAAAIATAGLLFYQHRIVRPDDLEQVQRAFFTLNAVISTLLMVALVLEFVVGGGGV